MPIQQKDIRTQIIFVDTLIVTALHVRPVLFEIVAHQFIEALVTRGVLHKTCLIAETVIAIGTTAMEM